MTKTNAHLTTHRKTSLKLVGASLVLASVLLGCQSPSNLQSQSVENLVLPKIISNNGKHAFLVDGKPYLILGAQANNSANYPGVLDKVWPVVEKMSANSLSIPVAWEQIEPVEGEFDFSYLDVLLQQAREKEVRIALLWFATWKNNAPHYAPSWVKLDNKRFPRVVKKDGSSLNSMSPLGDNTLAADKKAYI
jgi:beta-galactosidase GanA